MGRGLQPLSRTASSLLLAAILALVSPLSLSGDAALSFGAGPYQSPAKMAEHWLPVVKYLSAKSGLLLQFATTKDLSSFQEQLRNGEYDVTFMNPLVYIEMHKTVGYDALVRGKLKTAGVIVVPMSSRYKELTDLQGADIAFPSELAFGPTMLPQAVLKQRGIRTTPHYVGSHESVYRAVANSNYAAGGGVKHTFEALDPGLRSNLRILWASEPFTAPPIAVHPRVSAADRAKLSAALLHMHEDAEGARLLAVVGLPTGFDPAQENDWDSLRSLRADGPESPQR